MVPVRKDGSLRAHKNKGVVCPGGGDATTRVSGETIEAKAARYLREGRVQVVSIHEGRILVLVRGSKPDPYTVRFTNGVWVCSCEAQVWRCSHVAAVQLVVSPNYRQRELEPPAVGSVTEELDGLLGGRLLQRPVGREEAVEV
jgi:uncharacterized Zn finger protein